MKYFLIKEDQQLQYISDFRPIWTPRGSSTGTISGGSIAPHTARVPDRFACTLPGLGPLPKPFQVTDENANVYDCTAAAVLQKDRLLVTGAINSEYKAGNEKEAIRLITEELRKLSAGS